MNKLYKGGSLMKKKSEHTTTLGLDDLVEPNYAYPQKWFPEKNEQAFITLRQFLLNADNIERWRYLNNYSNYIDFTPEVYTFVRERYGS